LEFAEFTVGSAFLLGAGRWDGSGQPRRSIKSYKRRLGTTDHRLSLYEEDGLLYGCYSLDNE
jgi:hypothetical protein